MTPGERPLASEAQYRGVLVNGTLPSDPTQAFTATAVITEGLNAGEVARVNVTYQPYGDTPRGVDPGLVDPLAATHAEATLTGSETGGFVVSNAGQQELAPVIQLNPRPDRAYLGEPPPNAELSYHNHIQGMSPLPSAGDRLHRDASAAWTCPVAERLLSHSGNTGDDGN